MRTAAAEARAIEAEARAVAAATASENALRQCAEEVRPGKLNSYRGSVSDTKELAGSLPVDKSAGTCWVLRRAVKAETRAMAAAAALENVLCFCAEEVCRGTLQVCAEEVCREMLQGGVMWVLPVAVSMCGHSQILPPAICWNGMSTLGQQTNFEQPFPHRHSHS